MAIVSEPPDPCDCTAQAADALHQATEAARVLNPDDQSRALTSIARTWLALAIAVAEHPNMQPPKQDDDT